MSFNGLQFDIIHMKIGHKENIKLKQKNLSNCSLYAFQRKPLEPSAKGLLLGSKEPLTKKEKERGRAFLYIKKLL
jgi:hypothetical protein